MKALNDLFILEGMKDSTVLAGHRGLTRHVQFVNISDTPDVIQFLDKNHLLLTTAYPFKNNPQKLCELIKQMHALNCSGMVMKVKRFLKELPDEVKLLADNLSFPLIDLPLQYTLGDVSRHILNFLNNHEAEQLYYALHIQREFSDMMFREYNLQALIGQLGHFLERPVILLNHRGDFISHSYDFQKDSMKIAEKEIIQTVKQDIDNIREGATFTTSVLAEQSVTSFPVQTKRKYPSMLIIIDYTTLPYPSSQIAIEQAGNVLSFTMIKEQAINENSRLLKNNFFADLIEEKIQSEKEIISRANYYGLKTDMESICIVCAIDTEGENYETLRPNKKNIAELHNSIYDQLEDELMNANLNATIFTRGKFFVMLLQFPEYTESVMNRIKDFIEVARDNIQEEFSISFGISNQIQRLNDIPVAYQEAVEAIKNGYLLKKKGFINFYKTKEVKELLNIIPRKDLQALYENTFKMLAYPNTKDDQELVKTIEVYLDCQCEISETSRKLFVHRNTVKYRIKKAEELLNCSFQDPDDSLRIRVSLIIGTILKEDK